MTKLQKMLANKGMVVTKGKLYAAYEVTTGSPAGPKKGVKFQELRKAEAWEVNEQNRWNIQHGINESAN